MSNLENIMIDAFFDGLTGAGLFGRLRRPSAPTEYVDSRSLADMKRGGEFEAIGSRLRRYVGDLPDR